MPPAIIGAVIAAVAAVGSAVIQSRAAKKQARALRRQQEAEEEARRTQQASEEARARNERRRAARERRIRTAQIQAEAGNQGVGESSGAIGAESVLGTNLGAVAAEGQRQTTAARAISRQRSIAAQEGANAQLAVLRGNAQAATVSAIGSIGSSFAGALGGFGGTTTPNIAQQQATGATIAQTRAAGVSGIELFGLR